MSFKLDDRVKETTTTTSTGTVTLLGAATGYVAFSAFMANLDTTYYCIAHQTANEWEVGLGTWNTGGTLSRTTVLKSTNAGAAVNFSAGTKDVFCTLPGNKVTNWGSGGGGLANPLLYTTSSTTPDITASPNLTFNGTVLYMGNTTQNSSMGFTYFSAQANTTYSGFYNQEGTQLGNDTINSTSNSTSYRVTNSSINTVITSGSIRIGTTTLNNVISQTTVVIGNTTLNNVISQTTVVIGNTTVNATYASNNVTIGASVISNTKIQVGNSTVNASLSAGSWQATEASGGPLINANTTVINLIANGTVNGTLSATTLTLLANSTANSVLTGNSFKILEPSSVNLTMNTTSIVVGNTTLNSVSTGANLIIADGTFTGQVGSNRVSVGNSTTNSSLAAGQIFVSDASFNIFITTTSIRLGNTTVNNVINTQVVIVSGTTVGSNLTSSGLTTGNNTLNTSITGSTLIIGNSTVNTTVSQSTVDLKNAAGTISVGNSTVNSTVNATALGTGNSTAVSIQTSRDLTMGSWTGNTQPATPAADRGIMFFQTSANRQMLFGMGPAGIDYMVQPHVGRNRAIVFWPKGNLAAITDAVGWTAVNTAVMIARTVTAAATANAMYLSMRKVSIASNATANTVGELRADSAQIMYGNVAGVGGFHAIFRFGFNTLSTNGRAFVGFATGTGQLPNGNPSAQTNIIGCGREAGQLHLQIYSNDGTGTATMTNTGITCNTTADQSNGVYELVLFKPASTDINTYWQVLKLNTNQVANGTISTDLVANNTLLCPRFWVCSGTDASVNALDIMSMYIECDN